MKTNVIILAAGKGTRMNHHLPKALLPVAGVSMIERVVTAVEKAKFGTPPIIVVGHQAKLVQQTIGPRALYAFQRKQLGTGHAVAAASTQLKKTKGNIVVIYCDQPFITAKTLQRLVQQQQKTQAGIAALTVTVPDFTGPRLALQHCGRIVRDKRRRLMKSVEVKDATSAERRIREVNPCVYCFDAKWLWKNLPELRPTNAQHEYYLTDLLERAVQAGEKVALLKSKNWVEALGVNSPDDLRTAERLMRTYGK